MRERTTWNREEIAKRASDAKTADDPRAMNQDHHSQQPADDKYVTGGPSEFAEDVTPPNWKVEQAGGETKRDEIGMPEMLPDTFKTAGLDEETLHKKAEVCIKVARQMIPGADESAVEDQAFALMHMPDVELIQTADRLAKGKVPPEFLEQQQKMKDKAKDKGDDDAKDDDGEKKEAAKKSEDEGGDDGQQAEGQDDAEAEAATEAEQAEQAEKKQAAYKQAADALQAGDVTAFKGAINDIVAYTFSEQQQVQQAQQQQVQQAGQGCMSAQQVEQMIQQAIDAKTLGTMDQQAIPPGIAEQQVQLSDDQMLDQMLQDEAPVQQAPPMDVQLEGAPMDIGEVQLGPEDDVLGQLFASDKEVQQAMMAQALTDGTPPPAAAPPVKTASTRTVGTRPTGGVSQIGGTPGDAPTGGDVDKLSGLWRSAPDVSGIFNPEG